MYNNKATKNAKTSNNKKMTTLNRKTIPYQAHHNSANVLQLETKKSMPYMSTGWKFKASKMSTWKHQ